MTTRTIRIGEENHTRLEARYGKFDGRGRGKQIPKEEMIRRLLDEADQMDIEEETE